MSERNSAADWFWFLNEIEAARPTSDGLPCADVCLTVGDKKAESMLEEATGLIQRAERMLDKLTTYADGKHSAAEDWESDAEHCLGCEELVHIDDGISCLDGNGRSCVSCYENANLARAYGVAS